MTEAVITDEALKLQPWAREIFLYGSMESLGLADEAYNDGITEEELKRRCADIDDPNVKWIPWEDVKANVESKLATIRAERKGQPETGSSLEDIDRLEKAALQLPEAARKNIAARLWEEPEDWKK